MKKLIIFLSIGILGCLYYIYELLPQKYLEVSFLSVGQGDAIFIETPNHNQILIDGGPDQVILRELSKKMLFFDKYIDIVIASHPDTDHIGGLNSVFKRYEVGQFLETEVQASSTAFLALQENKPESLYVKRGMEFVLDKDIYLTILFPDRPTTGWETNTASIIAKLRYGSSSVLLTGDSPAKIEKFLVRVDGKDLRSNILKLGHHGSNTSSDPTFIQTVEPDFAIVSSGKNNRYKHPHPRVIETVKEATNNILNTAEEGAITFYMDKERVWRDD